MIVDANPIVTACLGLSEPLFHALIAGGHDLFVPEHQLREARLVTATQAPKRGRDPASAFAWVEEVAEPVLAEIYAEYEEEARARLKKAGQKDWPMVALALATGDDVWSNDVHLLGTGIAVWNTHNMRRLARGASVVASKD